jgi:hypothetical protein
MSIIKGRVKELYVFTFEVDVGWFLRQMPKYMQSVPMNIVHGLKGKDAVRIERPAKDIKTIRMTSPNLAFNGTLMTVELRCRCFDFETCRDSSLQSKCASCKQTQQQ